MLVLEVEARSRTDSVQATVGHIHTIPFHLSDKLRSLSISARIEVDIVCQAQATTTHIRHPVRVVFCNFVELIFEVGSDLDGALDQVLLSNDLILLGHEQCPHGVSHPGIEMTEGKFGPEFIRVVEARGLGLLGKTHKVWRRFQVPVLVRPVASAACDASVHLVNDHVNAHLLGHLAQLVGKEARDVVVTAGRLNRLEHHGSNLNSLGRLPVLDLILDVPERREILLAIVGFICRIFDWIAVHRRLGHGPVEGWNIDFAERSYSVSVPCCRQTTKHCPVESIFER